MTHDDELQKALGKLRCARANFAVFRADDHPVYILGRHQLDCAIAILEGKPVPELER